MVTPLSQCIARPSGGVTDNKLVSHLEAVAVASGIRNGTIEERLDYLAGLLHDIAKAQYEWQEYILEKIPKGPPHAPLGAALFAFCAENLIPIWTTDTSLRERLYDYSIDWARSIYSHHIKLVDLDHNPPWETNFSTEAIYLMLKKCDHRNIFLFISKHFPEFKSDETAFSDWLDNLYDIWEERKRFGRDKILCDSNKLNPNHEVMPQFAMRFPKVASRLVCADRYHVGNFQEIYLIPQQTEHACQRFNQYCLERAKAAIRKNADPELVRRRQSVQQKTLTTYCKNTKEGFFSLLLPTGYGKTLTSLRIALEACRKGICRRVLYIAPYLSILSQAAGEISAATGMEVFQHHHLSLAEIDNDDEANVLDTWQAPILATTFNQFFRALFPRRAQQCLRINALKHAFIIIDEPQIVSVDSWNVFLRGLEALRADFQYQVLFTTATMPPTGAGLGQEPISLAPQHIQRVDRFTLRCNVNFYNAETLAEALVQPKGTKNSKAIVLNTVADAASIFDRLNKAKFFESLYCLTAMMLPSHKMAIIEDIRRDLDAGREPVAVCTQILEAGVDLSFRELWRASAIFPAIAQVAGRANRHGEGEKAVVTIFTFLRDDGQDARRWVYRDETACRHTDKVLEEFPQIKEEILGDVLKKYYNRCWRENRYEACLKRFELAAKGQWSKLSEIEPFGGGALRVDIFVPWRHVELPPVLQKLMNDYAPDNVIQLLAKYQDRDFLQHLSFLEKKRFMMLIRQYTVAVPKGLAERVGKEIVPGIWRLLDIANYSNKTGLAHLLVEKEENECLII
jgi:CRISPR-associated helicase Cas3